MPVPIPYIVTAKDKKANTERKFSVSGPYFTSEEHLKANFESTHASLYDYVSCEPAFPAPEAKPE